MATTQTTDSSTTYPDRDTTWSEEQEIEDGISVVFNSDRIRGCGMDHGLRSQMVGYVVDGHDRLISEYTTNEIVIPKYYSRFDEFDPYFHLPTIRAGGNSVGWGIDKYRLENAVRIATGGGRYSTDDVRVFACGDARFVVEYDGEMFLFPMRQLKSFPEGYEPPTWEISGFDVPEGNATYREALERILNHLNADITEYVKSYSGKHVFHNANGREVYVRTNDISKVAGTPTDPSDVAQSYEIETEYDETYEVSWDDVEYDYGDTYDDWYHDDAGTVVGFQLRWEDPRTSSRVSMSGKITVDATYSVVRYVDNTDNRYSYDEISVKRETERLAEFDPRNEDYSILDM